MNFTELTAISPVDGRYRNKTENLSGYFSEYALIKYRVFVEVEYFIALVELPLPELKNFDKNLFKELRTIYRDFELIDAIKIKEIEKETNHDVKAVEYFIKEKFAELKILEYKEFIHFGLTSQDINNTAIPYTIQLAMNEVYYPLFDKLLQKIQFLAAEWHDIPMLSRTHGQPASPTRLGKEMEVFIERLKKQSGLLRLVPFSAKFGGASGNFNAHSVAYPNVKWEEFANSFVNHVLNLDRSQITTQIEHYDNIAALFDNLKRINTIFTDLARDVWTYISMDYFKMNIKNKEVGSSTMPHKVNPIDFENAEGNFGVANAVFEHLALKLPISRLQRDLTDSTVLRNIGVPFAHTLIGFKSMLKGLNKIKVNKNKINEDLESNWMVVAEAIQTILRREGYDNPYEKLKELTRKNETISEKNISEFIDNLEINEDIKNELKQITPFNYTGI